MQQTKNRQQLFDSFVGLALEKQCAFVDTVPDHCWTWQWLEKGDLRLLNFPHLGTYEYQRLGTEFYDNNTWGFAWAEESISPIQSRASAAFHNHFKKSYDLVLSRPFIELSKVNGDYLAVIATQLLDASTYFAWPNEGGTSTSFYLLFDLPLVNHTPTPLMRIINVVEMLFRSGQVSDKELAIGEYLRAKGFSSTVTDIENGHRETFTDAIGRCITYDYTHKYTRKGDEKFIISQSYKVEQADYPAKPVLRTVSLMDYEVHCDYFIRSPLDRLAEFQ